MKSPNYTQISNEFLESMHQFTGEQVKVFMAICRKTIGWHRLSGKVSYSQITEMTGIKHRQTLNQAITALKDAGWITVSGDSKRGYFYDLNIETRSPDERPRSRDERELVHGVNESNSSNGSGIKKYPAPKEKKETIKKESTAPPSVAAPNAAPKRDSLGPVPRNRPIRAINEGEHETVAVMLGKLNKGLKSKLVGDSDQFDELLAEAMKENSVTAGVA